MMIHLLLLVKVINVQLTYECISRHTTAVYNNATLTWAGLLQYKYSYFIIIIINIFISFLVTS